jgi:hypothetical protein
MVKPAAPRPSRADVEREIRARIAALPPWSAERRRMQRYLVIARGHARWQRLRAAQMSPAALINAYAVSPSDQTLIDMRGRADEELFRIIDTMGARSAQEADSAIAELRARANALQVTVADYIGRRGRPCA